MRARAQPASQIQSLQPPHMALHGALLQLKVPAAKQPIHSQSCCKVAGGMRWQIYRRNLDLQPYCMAGNSIIWGLQLHLRVLPLVAGQRRASCLASEKAAKASTAFDCLAVLAFAIHGILIVHWFEGSICWSLHLFMDWTSGKLLSTATCQSTSPSGCQRLKCTDCSHSKRRRAPCASSLPQRCQHQVCAATAQFPKTVFAPAIHIQSISCHEGTSSRASQCWSGCLLCYILLCHGHILSGHQSTSLTHRVLMCTDRVLVVL